MNDKPTYTLWIGSSLVATRSHTTENYIDLLGIAADTRDQHVCIYSSREDVPVYDSNDEDNVPFDMDDVSADADALAGAGYGTDEDYGYHGDEDYGW